MENSTEKLIKCFERLQIRLHYLKSGQVDPNSTIKHPYSCSHPIDDIVLTIYSVPDLEKAEDHLNYYIEQVEDLIVNISELASNYKFEDDMRGIFTSHIPVTRKAENKREFKKVLVKELNYYKENLKKIRDQVIDKFKYTQSTDLVRNKIAFNLNGNVLASLFNLLYDTEVIKHKRSDGTDFSKIDLARFICSNFSSSNKADLSFSTMKNQISRTDTLAEEKACEALNKMLKYAHS